MTAKPHAARGPLFRSVLAINLALALAVGAGAAAVAFFGMVEASEYALRDEIDAELRAVVRRHAARGITSVGDELEFRALHARGGDALALYLMTRADGSRVVGNLARWPESRADAEGWLRFDGAAAGVAPGRVLARSVSLGGRRVLVGRRLALDALWQRFAVALAAIVAAACALAVVSTRRAEREFRGHVARLVAVFEAVQGGALSARVGSAPGESAELASLARHVDAALAELQRLVRGLDAFSQSAAHELNRELARLRDEARASGAERFARAADELLQLLREILSLARIEASPGFEAKATDLRAIAERAAALYEDSFEAAGVALAVDAAGGSDARIRAVEPLVASAVANLLENALKHSAPGTHVRLAVRADGDVATVGVRDEGPGAPSEDPAALAALGARGAARGHGFGLRFVQAVAIRHGAELTLRNAAPGFEAILAFPRWSEPRAE